MAAADLAGSADTQVLMAPTMPLGLASDFPKSPLTESFVEGSVRFPDERQARASCPADVVVWVENGSTFYQPVRYARSVGSGFGAYMCQAAALSEGDSPIAARPRLSDDRGGTAPRGAIKDRP